MKTIKDLLEKLSELSDQKSKDYYKIRICDLSTDNAFDCVDIQIFPQTKLLYINFRSVDLK